MVNIEINNFDQLDKEQRKQAVKEKYGERALSIFNEGGRGLLEIFLQHEERKPSLIQYLVTKGVYILSSQQDLDNIPKEQETNLRALASSLTIKQDDTLEALKKITSFSNECYIDGIWICGAWHVVPMFDECRYKVSEAREAGKPVLITLDSAFELKTAER